MNKFTPQQAENDEIGFYVSPSFLEKNEACWTKGGLKVCAKTIGNRIHVEVTLANIHIGDGDLTASSNRLCFTGNAGVVKASLCVEANFPSREVRVEGEMCVKVIFVGWECDSFNAKFMTW